ncbi:hypothetical protein KTQ42_22815 [Noviherbaspirillum sp. L7-7A]|uniref:hypothetical protein n=1 Tax=Noviherbaspirillum sp. L7-7A TaxID=2850560 RepID=UPI001C2BBF06|nr:hypothetical protein [Noviherbaspirillum sp. L7-7A]MBV0882112.1 hypothetical protein [Noviherbaspirillum sp. L7-7A]
MSILLGLRALAGKRSMHRLNETNALPSSDFFEWNACLENMADVYARTWHAPLIECTRHIGG